MYKSSCLKIKGHHTVTPPEPRLVEVGASLHHDHDHHHQQEVEGEHQASHPSCQLAPRAPTGDAQKRAMVHPLLARQRPRNGTFAS